MPDLKLIIPTRHRCREALLDFLLAKKASGSHARTIEFYERTAGDFVAWLIEQGVSDPEQMTRRHVSLYLVHVRERGVSEATARIHAQGVRTFCRFAFSEWDTPRFEIEMPKPERKRMRFPSVEQFDELLKACTRPRDKALLLFLADTGARVSEAAALNWGDVDVDKGKVWLGPGKTRQSRTVMVGITTRRALLRYRQTCPSGATDPLWMGERGRMTRDGIRHLFRRLEQRTGLKCGCHDLRRFFATQSLRNGMPANVVQDLLGHSSFEMTRRYLGEVDDMRAEAHATFGPVDHWVQSRREHGGNR